MANHADFWWGFAIGGCSVLLILILAVMGVYYLARNNPAMIKKLDAILGLEDANKRSAPKPKTPV